MSEKNSIVAVIDKTQDRFKIAPPAIKFEAEKGFALALLNNNSQLMQAAQGNPASLAQAVASVASIGLSLNPAEKQAYLITRNVKVGNNQWQTRVCLEPSYVGFCKLATDSGAIEWVQAKCVYSNDEFMDNGPGEKPTHKYNAFAKLEQRGEFVGAYCVAKTSGGDYLTEVMAAEDIYGIMERSESVKSARKKNKPLYGPWATDFPEMAKKSVIRRAFKTWPQSTGRMAEAVHMSNENEGFEPILTTPNLGQYTAEQKKYFDQLIEQGDALGMYVFQRTLEDQQVFTNLYHSFEKGQKGKFQAIIDDLRRKGQSIFTDCVDAMRGGIESGDDAAVIEIAVDLTQDALDLALNECEAAIAHEIRKLIEQEAA